MMQVLKGVIRSFKYALMGLNVALKEERNLRIDCLLLLITLLLGFYFKITVTNWLLIILGFFVLMGAELMNTTIENIMDFINPEHHLMVKKIKDLAAASVLVVAIGVGMVLLLVFLPYIIGG